MGAMHLYTIQRLVQLQRHCSLPSDRWQISRTLLGSVLWALSSMLLMSAVPLKPPTHGPTQSATTWTLVFLFTIVVCAMHLLQLRAMIPQIHIRLFQAMLVTLVVATSTTAYVLALAHVIGYPLPFTANVGAPVYILLFNLCIALILGRHYAHHWPQLRHYFAIIVFQGTVGATYPAISVGFAALDTHAQVYYTLLFPSLKYAIKRAMARLMRGLPDLTPLFVTLNVQVYHALFVSVCMKSSTSWLTTALLMLFDVTSAAYSIHHLRRRASTLQRLVHQPGATTAVVPPLLDATIYLLRDKATGERLPRTATMPLGVPLSFNNVAPYDLTASSLQTASLSLSKDHRHVLDLLSKDDRFQFVQEALTILYRAESFLLAEYVEVVVPVIYSVYVVVASSLPNHVYHTDLRDLSTNEMYRTAANVMGYALLELASFAPLDWILRLRLGFPTIQQLAFALQSQALLVQATIAVWLLMTMQGSMEQYGADYSFQFEWLRRTPPQ